MNKSQKIQFEIVAVLGLLALFTHMHIFWVAGLLLALIDIPDLGSFLGRIAGSVEKIAGVKPLEEAGEVQSPEIVAGSKRTGEAAGLALLAHDRGGKGEGTLNTADKIRERASKKEGVEPCLNSFSARFLQFFQIICTAAMLRESGSARRLPFTPSGSSSDGGLRHALFLPCA